MGGKASDRRCNARSFIAKAVYYLPTTELLLETLGANVNATERSWNSTPLMTACNLGLEDSARILLSHRANVNVMDRSGNTVLQVAASKVSLKMVTTIVRAGADINLQQRNRSSALMVSIHGRDPRVAPWLIEHGANVNAVGSNGITALKIVRIAEARLAARSIPSPSLSSLESLLLAHGAK